MTRYESLNSQIEERCSAYGTNYAQELGSEELDAYQSFWASEAHCSNRYGGYEAEW